MADFGAGGSNDEEVSVHGGNGAGAGAGGSRIQDCLTRFQKMHPPKFFGNEGTEAAENWLISIEKLFEVMGFSDDHQVKLAAFQLEGQAYGWWTTQKKAMTARGENPTWEIFQTRFLRRYSSVSYRESKEAEFYQLKQGSMTVEEYTTKFSDLLRYVPQVAMDHHTQYQRFVRGLRGELFTLISGQKSDTFEEMMDRALAYEEGLNFQREERQHTHQYQGRHPRNNRQDGGNRSQFRPRGTSFKKSGNSGGSSRSSSSSGSNRGGSSIGASNPCSQCGGRHAEGSCPPFSGTCYNCGGQGHYAYVCPSRNQEVGGNRSFSGRGSRFQKEVSSQGSVQRPNQSGGRGPFRGRGSGSQVRPAVTGQVYAMNEEQARESSEGVIAGKLKDLMMGEPSSSGKGKQ